MDKEVRIVKYDPALQIEAYHFAGVAQNFPNHFHDYYVIGMIERGQRLLSCKGREYNVESGDLLVFNPRDNHVCSQVDGRPFTYRCVNISEQAMARAAFEITGSCSLPHFSPPVIFRSDLAPLFGELHRMILRGETDFRKEELFFFLLEQLIEEHTEQAVPVGDKDPSAAVSAVCAYLEAHFPQSISLDELSGIAGLSKYYLLRTFTKQKGISPYSYLETIRIARAKKLLEQGVPPLDAALQTGFADQSHFSNFFKKLIGLTPRQYRSIFAQAAEQPDGNPDSFQKGSPSSCAIPKSNA